MDEGFKVGDFVFFEFKLGQIVKMEGSRVVEFSDGMFTTCCNDLTDRCVPLSLVFKRISDEYEHHSARIHNEGISGLNYPDIHRWIVDAWSAACDDVDNLKTHYEKVQQFTKDVLEKCDVDSGYGFALMRRRAS